MLTVNRRHSIHKQFQATRDRQICRAWRVERHDKTGRQHRSARWVLAITGLRKPTCTGRMIKKCSLAVIGKVSAPASRIQVNDIDLFVPGEHFSSVVQAGQEFVSKAAAHRQEEGWDLTYVQFKYEGIKVEVGNANGPRIFDLGSQTWIPLNIDFSRYKTMHLLGLDLPLMLKEDLVRYKSALSRPVDIEDIRAIGESA